MQTIQTRLLQLWRMKYGKMLIAVVVVFLLGGILTALNPSQATPLAPKATATELPPLTYGMPYSTWLARFRADTPVAHTATSATYRSGFASGSLVTITETHNIVSAITVTFTNGTFTTPGDVYTFCVYYMPNSMQWTHTVGNTYYWTGALGNVMITATTTSCEITKQA